MSTQEKTIKMFGGEGIFRLTWTPEKGFQVYARIRSETPVTINGVTMQGNVNLVQRQFGGGWSREVRLRRPSTYAEIPYESKGRRRLIEQIEASASAMLEAPGAKLITQAHYYETMANMATEAAHNLRDEASKKDAEARQLRERQSRLLSGGVPE